jgi:hypothetical protein
MVTLKNKKNADEEFSGVLFISLIFIEYSELGEPLKVILFDLDLVGYSEVSVIHDNGEGGFGVTVVTGSGGEKAIHWKFSADNFIVRYAYTCYSSE